MSIVRLVVRSGVGKVAGLVDNLCDIGVDSLNQNDPGKGHRTMALSTSLSAMNDDDGFNNTAYFTVKSLFHISLFF